MEETGGSGRMGKHKKLSSAAFIMPTIEDEELARASKDEVRTIVFLYQPNIVNTCTSLQDDDEDVQVSGSFTLKPDTEDDVTESEA